MCEFCKHHCWVGINYCPKCGRKANRMSDNLDKIITNVIEAEKNGVKIIIKQQYNKEINDINIDFSEHDKVFEDKIVELKKDYKTASELLGKYQQENESLKKRIIELENFSCQAEQETESLFEKLKQRIAELEDKIGDRDEINRCLREQIEELQKKNENLTEEYKVMSDFANKQMQKCEKLESRETENTVEVRVPASPIEIATYLINNTCTINELKMIAEHINVYCNGGK